MAGLDSLTSGDVLIGDTTLGTLNERKLTLLRRDNVGFVFQAFNLVPTLSALENITLPMDLAGVAPDQAWLDQVIETVGLADRTSHRPNELSGGQQQRVAIARAMVSHPEIILADEPTANLDSKTGIALLDLMKELNEQHNMTFVFSTHDEKIMNRASRLIHIQDGEIELDERK